MSEEMRCLWDWLVKRRNEDDARHKQCVAGGYEYTAAGYDGSSNAFRQVMAFIEDMYKARKPMSDITTALLGTRITAKDGKYYIDGEEIHFIEDCDQCACTYAGGEIAFHGEGVITKVETVSEDAGEDNPPATLKVTVFHENEKLAEIDMEAGSSGWRYGSTCTLLIGEDEIAEVVW